MLLNHRHPLAARLLALLFTAILFHGCGGGDEDNADGVSDTANATDTASTTDVSGSDPGTNLEDTVSVNDLAATDSSTNNDPGTPPVDPPNEVDPNCTDGLYTETLPNFFFQDQKIFFL